MTVTSLAKKLQIKPGVRVLLRGAPSTVVAALSPLPEGASLVKAGRDADLAVLFVTKSSEIAAVARDAKALPPIVWLAYPKKTSGVKTDLTRDAGWDPLFDAGWVGVASVAIDDTWSGLRVRPGTDAERAKVTELRRPRGGRPKKAPPKPPADLVRALAKSAAAKKVFTTLSPSHVREYVGWIEEAKKPETRAARVAKTVTMLAAGQRDRNAKYA